MRRLEYVLRGPNLSRSIPMRTLAGIVNATLQIATVRI
uniref:Uncharacterized protein n=1 Tax=Prochlorococcus marinus str. P0902-H212 TaxID=1620696 RepID=A0A0D5A299_PROMR|nr:hypothetical protein FA02_0367 [Prochlorococcus marinus str. P0902-H212]